VVLDSFMVAVLFSFGRRMDGCMDGPAAPISSVLARSGLQIHAVPSQTRAERLATDDREKEIARLLELDATRGADHDEYDQSWTVMADPEGKRFCIA
jgi:hypothetical protein